MTRRDDPYLNLATRRTKPNWAGMIWWTFWFVVVFSLIAAAVIETLDILDLKVW